MVWGSLIAWYLFLAGAGAGAFIASAYIDYFYPNNIKMRVAGRIIAPVLLGVGLLLLMLDAEAGLHNPLRFFGLVLNPASVMTLGVYFICVFLPVSLVSAVLEVLKKKVPLWLSGVGVVFAFAVAAYTGFLLGVVQAYPLWNNAVLPVLFVISALSSGMALTSLVGLAIDRHQFQEMESFKRWHLIIGGVEIVVIATMLIIVSTGSGAGAASVSSLVSGQYAPVFWGGLMVYGLLVPLFIQGSEIWRKTKSSRESLEVTSSQDSLGAFALHALGEIGTVTGGILLRFLVIFAAVPIVFL